MIPQLFRVAGCQGAFALCQRTWQCGATRHLVFRFSFYGLQSGSAWSSPACVSGS